jgi:hypothetical protein
MYCVDCVSMLTSKLPLDLRKFKWLLWAGMRESVTTCGCSGKILSSSLISLLAQPISPAIVSCSYRGTKLRADRSSWIGELTMFMTVA